jgi:hypothetical protein
VPRGLGLGLSLHDLGIQPGLLEDGDRVAAADAIPFVLQQASDPTRCEGRDAEFANLYGSGYLQGVRV